MKSQLPASSKSKLKSQWLMFWVVLICLFFGSPLYPANAQEPLDPIEPPAAPPQGEISQQSPQFPAILDFESRIFLPLILRPSAFPVNPQNRAESLSFYQQQYKMTSYPTSDWTGSQGTCNPGATSVEFRAAILRRINYFRAMAGVPNDVTFSDASNQKAQAAALIMSANQSLSHGPTQTWACYSDLGRNGAASANLYLGHYGWEAIDGYIEDPGEGNYPVGHRRWILYPQTKEMGTGDIPQDNGYPSAQALVVFDSHLWDPRPTTREEFVAWPPPGYVPYQVVFGRWSFAYAGADFSNASVQMSSEGQNIPVNQSPVVKSFGENTLVWIPEGHSYGETWPQPASDTAYTVTLQNVIINETPRSFTYTVIIFDPGL